MDGSAAMRMAQVEPGLDRALAILRRRKWWIALAGSAAIVATVSTVTFLPDLYQASVTVLVERQQVPEDFVRSTDPREVDSRLQGISQEIMSRSRLIGLIERFDLYPKLRSRLSMEDVVGRMRDHIWLDQKGFSRNGLSGSTIGFTIGYQGGDPQKVADVANELASTYIEEDLKLRGRQTIGTAEFLHSELEAMKRKLEEQERAVKDFKERSSGELPQQETANLATIDRLGVQLLLNGEKQAIARERQTALGQDLSESGSVAASPEALAARFAVVSRELEELKKEFTDKYPDVVRKQAELAALERRLREPAVAARSETGRRRDRKARPSDRAEAIPAASAELKLLKLEEERLKRQIAEVQGRIGNTPRREQEYQALLRDYETTQQVYSSLLKKREEAQLARSMEETAKGQKFRILDAAIVPERPVGPKRLRLIFVGLLVSVGFAAAAGALAEALDTSIHEAAELRALSPAPILARIPSITTASDRRRERMRFLAGTATAMVGFCAIVAGAYVIATQNEWLAGLLG